MKKNIKLLAFLFVMILIPFNVYADDCALLGGTESKTVALVSWAFKLIRLGIPVLIVILGITDFLKILLSGEEKVYKESFNKFVKRIAIGMAFLFVPYLLFFVFQLSGVGEQYNIDNFYCGIIDQVSGTKGTSSNSDCYERCKASTGGNSTAYNECIKSCK